MAGKFLFLWSERYAQGEAETQWRITVTMNQSLVRFLELLEAQSALTVAALTLPTLLFWSEVKATFLAPAGMSVGEAPGSFIEACRSMGVDVTEVSARRSQIPGFVEVSLHWGPEHGDMLEPWLKDGRRFCLAGIENGPSLQAPYQRLLERSEEAREIVARLYQESRQIAGAPISPTET